MYQGCTVTKTSHLPIRYFLALLWAHPILHISTIRVKFRIPVVAETFIFGTASRPTLGSIQPPIKHTTGIPFLRVKRPANEADEKGGSPVQTTGTWRSGRGTREPTMLRMLLLFSTAHIIVCRLYTQSNKNPFTNCPFCPQSVLLCVVLLSEQTATFTLQNIYHFLYTRWKVFTARYELYL